MALGAWLLLFRNTDGSQPFFGDGQFSWLAVRSQVWLAYRSQSWLAVRNQVWVVNSIGEKMTDPAPPIFLNDVLPYTADFSKTTQIQNGDTLVSGTFNCSATGILSMSPSMNGTQLQVVLHGDLFTPNTTLPVTIIGQTTAGFIIEWIDQIYCAG
jgi:hypothetical protein